MVSHYVVVRYVPDPVTDERVNIGVIAINKDGRMLVRFVERWQRVKTFGDEDIKFLKTFARDMKARESLAGEAVSGWNLSHLSRLYKRSGKSIQFSEPRASTRTIEDLVNDVARRFLRERAEEPADVGISYQRRTEARAFATSILKDAFAQRFGRKAPVYVKNNVELLGSLSTHVFDVVGGNGQPLFAAQTLPLGVEKPTVVRDIDAAAWAVKDLAQRVPDFPVALIAPLRTETFVDPAIKDYRQRLTAIGTELNKEVLFDKHSTEEWARRMGDRVARHL